MFNQLQPRERLLIFVLIGLIAFGIFYYAGKKIMHLRARLSEQVVETRNASTELAKKIREYQYLQSLDTTENTTNATIMVKKMEDLVAKYGLEQQIQNMDAPTSTTTPEKYTRNTMSINFSSVHLEEVFRLIYDIEKNKEINGKIELLEFRKPFAGKEIFDAKMELSSYSR